MTNYYNWNKTLAYNADVTIVIGARGIGKTYGLRLQCIRDYIKHKYKFVEIVRYKNELSGVSNGYFNRIETNNEFSNYVFKTQGNAAYIAEKKVKDGKKPNWHLIGYFIALSQAQAIKKRTYDRVKRIIFDEAILDKTDRFHHYLSREFTILANVVDTVSRERPDIKCIKPSLYLLGNALDVMNPYFMHYNVGVPKVGYSWYKNKTMLLHYVQSNEYSKFKANNTVAGRMLSGTEEGNNNINNEFSKINNDFVMKKNKEAKFEFGIIYDNYSYGIWSDWKNGFYFINSKIPKNTNKPIYSLTLADNRLNYIAARKAETMLQGFIDLHYAGVLRYESISLRERFKTVLNLFGIK